MAKKKTKPSISAASYEALEDRDELRIAHDKLCDAVWQNLIDSPHPVACYATPDAIIYALEGSQWAVSVPDDADEGGKLAAIVVALKDSPYALSAAQLAV